MEQRYHTIKNANGYPQLYIFKNQKYKEIYPINVINDVCHYEKSRNILLNYLKNTNDPIDIRNKLSMILDDERLAYIIELRYLNGLTYNEIANILHVCVTRLTQLRTICKRRINRLYNQSKLMDLALLSKAFNDKLNSI